MIIFSWASSDSKKKSGFILIIIGNIIFRKLQVKLFGYIFPRIFSLFKS